MNNCVDCHLKPPFNCKQDFEHWCEAFLKLFGFKQGIALPLYTTVIWDSSVFLYSVIKQFTQAHLQKCMYMHKHIHMYTNTPTHKSTCDIHRHPYPHRHTHAFTLTQTHTLSHTHTHIYP